MGKPSAGQCPVIIRSGDYSIRAARVGKSPLVNIWVHEDGNGGRGILVRFDEAVEFIEGLNVILDEIEVDTESSIE